MTDEEYHKLMESAMRSYESCERTDHEEYKKMVKQLKEHDAKRKPSPTKI